MNRSVYLFSLFLYLLPALLVAEVESYEFYDLSISESEQEILKKANYAFGSGLSFKKHGRRNAKVFYTLSDGELSFDASSGSQPPVIATITLRNSKAILDRVTPLSLAPGLSVPENPLVDLEGIATAPGDTVWLVDEVGPSLLRVDSKHGVVTAWIRPGHGFPGWLTKASRNRGFEGVARLENNDILAILQSPFEEEPGVYRLLRYNPQKDQAETYFYSVPEERIRGVDELKIGGMQALDAERVLILEHGSRSPKEHCLYVQMIDLSRVKGVRDAEKLAEEKSDGWISGTLIASICDTGWYQKKVEGVTLSGNGSELALISDSDNEATAQLMIVKLSESLLPFRMGDILVLILLLIITVAMIAFVVAVVFQKKKSEEVT